MKITENLRAAANRQKEIAFELETECRLLEDNDFVKENEDLKEQTRKILADFKKISAEAASLAGENSGLKNALFEHVFNEKISIINNTAQKLNIYFHSEIDGETDRLSCIERNIKSRIHNIREILSKNNVEMNEEFNAKLNELSVSLEKKVTEARAKADKSSALFSREEREQLDALKNEEINDEQIRAVAKKNNFERFVGLNVLNAIGVFLLVVGAIAAARYTYMYVSDFFKGMIIFAFGGITLAAGEYLNRKKPNVFSLGISAGGIAILYVALAFSQFYLKIFPMYPALVICVFLTMGAFTLSARYNSQVIASFALIGGYLPMFSIFSGSFNSLLVYGAMVYFAALNLFALSISWNRKWRVTAFIGLSFNIIATTFICLEASVKGWRESNAAETVSVLPIMITIIYAAFAFLIYTAIPIVSSYHAKTKFEKSDIALLAINTFFSSVILYGVFARFDLGNYKGLLAIAFAVVYIFLSMVVEKKFPKEEKYIKALFFLTSLVFVVLIIPTQFGRVWLSLGWLAQGVVLALYGILKEEKKLIKSDSLFVYKYTAITFGGLLILGAYTRKKMMSSSFVSVYKYFALVNAWIFTIYIISKLGRTLINIYPDEQRYQIIYLIWAAIITATFFIAYAITRIKLLYGSGIKILSIVLYGMGIFSLLIINGVYSPVASSYFSASTPNPGITVIGTLILVVLSGFSILAARDAMKIIITERKKGIEWLPLVISGYFVVVLSQNLVAQYNLSFSSAIISVIYVLTALAWILYGFIRRFAFVRRFGLALTVFAVVKLFLVDLSGLSRGYRIIAFFILGIVLIAISFVYQYFSKRLELKGVVKPEVDKPNDQENTQQD